jgi:hypothetical protein
MIAAIKGDLALVDSSKLEILHDHHKDSFSYIRDREKQRDRLFLLEIALIAFLAVAVLFTANLGAVLQSVKFADAQANLGQLPIPAVITGSWAFLFALTLRYCQVGIVVERQYDYLHVLEARISSEFGDSNLYVRESAAYLRSYPVFSSWAWVSYVYIFPTLIVLVTTTLTEVISTRST